MIFLFYHIIVFNLIFIKLITINLISIIKFNSITILFFAITNNPN